MKPIDAKRSSVTPFIVFSDDWGVHPSSSQHIFQHIAEHHPIAWINTVGMRRPQLILGDLQKTFRKAKVMFHKPAPLTDGSTESKVRVYQPLMIPFNDIALVRRLNDWSARYTLRQIVQNPTFENPVVVTTVPNASDYVDSVCHRKIVYYCVDDFSEWVGLDKPLVLEMEAMLVEKADVFIATSPRLLEPLAATGKPTHLLTHGVDIELFSTDVPTEHAVLHGISEPRAGYFGLFDARSDQELIAEVAKQMPDVSFVIAGRVEVPVDRLRRLPNVHFIGLIPYAELPALIRGLDVLFIPYKVNALSDALSPLKFKEYLASGRPVVSTPIAAAEEFRDCISIAPSAKAWGQAILHSIRDTQSRNKDLALSRLAGESWENKAAQFLNYCDV